MKVMPQADEIRRLCEELNSPDTETVVETCATIAKAVCKCIPPAQAMDFLTAVLDSFLHVRPTCVKAVWKWVFVFLEECSKEIHQEVGYLFIAVIAFPNCGVTQTVRCPSFSDQLLPVCSLGASGLVLGLPFQGSCSPPPLMLCCASLGL
ncbi:hypothetical protein QYF61_026967 [Mycteria americana]|uniref:Maestro-like HEAT-repeats domain-containing protein n=1 Tax=Mycteria americana TaxID=33587 RepID=A0AAN7RRY4_MYCAM|nr:hypothetical protein QYF61_026967 [Mycteria americana]